MKKLLPYVLCCATAFYGLPLLGESTGGFMLILLIAIPLICLVVSFIFGMKYGLDLLYPLSVGLVFVPTIFMYYNSSASVYVFGYAALAMLGMFIGKSLSESKKI